MSTAAPPARRSRRPLVVVLSVAGLALLTLVLLGLRSFPLNRPVAYGDDAEHFKYGSIGADAFCGQCSGLPQDILLVLPDVFAEHLPPGAPPDLTAFGFVQEPGRPLPIGFSQRTQVIPLTGFNCAACHTGQVRQAGRAAPLVVLGMGAPGVNIQAYFEFLFRAAADPRFTAEVLLPAMERRRALGAVERAIYRQVIPRMRRLLLEKQRQLAPIFNATHPAGGPGRIDTFNPYKLMQLEAFYPRGVPDRERFGNARFASIWGMAAKERLALNWDGNAPSIRDRNMGAAMGAGAGMSTMDTLALVRIQRWLTTLPPPAWPFGDAADARTLAVGDSLFRHYCFDCHDARGRRIGQVMPLAEIGTDSNRLVSYSREVNDDFHRLGLSDMTYTEGYVNGILDGVWARAPYLHNGSVPTLWDLLTPAERRNGGAPSFFAGHGVYDTAAVGFRPDVAEFEGRPAFRYDLTLRGNSNRGHSGVAFGTALADHHKRALLAYLRTL